MSDTFREAVRSQQELHEIAPPLKREQIPLLLKLPDEDRDALVLVAVCRLGYQDTTKILAGIGGNPENVPVGKIKSRVRRARLRLIKLVASGETPDLPGIMAWEKYSRMGPLAGNHIEWALGRLYLITIGQNVPGPDGNPTNGKAELFTMAVLRALTRTRSQSP